MLLGIGVALHTEDFLMKSKGHMAWSAISALMFSSIFHRALNLLAPLGDLETTTKLRPHFKFSATKSMRTGGEQPDGVGEKRRYE
jgi:hypothetical protein